MAYDYTLKDGGERQAEATGLLREPNGGRGRYDLLSPLVLRRLSVIYERGADKYGDRNWEKGGKLSRFICSALRHTFQYLEGMRDEDHAAQALWNIAAIIHVEEMIKRGLMPAELDDLPNFVDPISIKGDKKCLK